VLVLGPLAVTLLRRQSLDSLSARES
jgi:hypothetical protein